MATYTYKPLIGNIPLHFFVSLHAADSPAQPMVKCKRRRRWLVKLRAGTAELGVETGRWHGLGREERVCKNCRGGEVEDEKGWVL